MRRLLAAVLLACCPSSTVLAQFETLLAKLPSDGNLLVTLNADQVFASGLATAEGWKQKYGDNYAESPMMLPPEATRFALASRLDPATLHPDWEAAVMTFENDLPMSAVARLLGGERDEIAGVEAVRTPKDSYVLKLGAGVFGVMRPADRQFVGRWARSSQLASGPPLSPYLMKAGAYPDRVGTEVIMALDLTDAIGAAAIRKAMSASPVVSEAGVDVEAATEELLSLEGLTLGVRITDKATGSLKVDFAKPISVLKPIGKKLLLEVFEEAGVAIDEFYDWKLQETATGFRISGRLEESGLRRLFSFLEIDASVVDAAAPEADSAADGATIDPYASVEYYQGVYKHLRDLKMESGAKSYSSIAYWYEKYANRIDRMPILHVDPELLDYSASVVTQLRDCAMAIRGVAVRSNSRGAGVRGSASVGPGANYNAYNNTYGYTVFTGSTYEQGKDAIRDADAQRRAINRQERAQGTASVQSIVEEIKQETSEIRRKMTAKHNLEF